MSRLASRLLGVLLVAAGGSLAQSVVVDRVAASVDDVAIPESEVRKAMLLSPLQPEAGESPEAFRARALEALIDQHLQFDDALRFGPAPPDAAEIEAALNRLRDRLRAEGKDPDAEFRAAGLTREEVRASLERQLVVRRYLSERFRPIAFAGEDRAREEYEKRYVAERRAANLPVLPFEEVAGQMRARSQRRAFEEETEKWIKELREKARITIYPAPAAAPAEGPPTFIATAPVATRTPAPASR